MVVVEMKTSTTSVVLSTGAGGETFGGKSGKREGAPSGSEAEGGPSFLGARARAALVRGRELRACEDD